MRRYYIGLATTFHDPAIAIVDPGGKVLFAEATERPLQWKRGINHDPDFFMYMPELLSRYCDPDAELVAATTWSRPFTVLLRLGTMAGAFRLERLRRIGSRLNRTLLEDDEELAYASLIYHMQEKAGLGVLLGAQTVFGHSRVRVRRYSHHLTHAAHALYTSPFESAVCGVVDGMGEFGSMAAYRYDRGSIRRIRRHWGRESVGFLYGLITDLSGYDWRLGEEWKVMGLAPYGKVDPELYGLFRRIYSISRGRIRFASRANIREAVRLLRLRTRAAGSSPIEAADLACTGQYVFSEIMNELLADLSSLDISPNLAFGGGCALNCSYNGTVVTNTDFERLYVPCAPGDDGNAVGAALLAYAEDNPGDVPITGFQSPYLGSTISDETLRRFLQYHGNRVRHLPGQIHERAAKLLANGKLIGWVQGRAEFGPRALGNRSILADPRTFLSRERISATVKLREEFRPFAPSILDEYGLQYFRNYQTSPYMERVLSYRDEVRDRIPAVVHVDGTGRVQSVRRQWNERYYDLIESFRQLTGVPMVLNTSFNIMGRPMVHSLESALGMFHTSGLDALIVDDYLLEK